MWAELVIFVWKFKIFVTMATAVGMTQISLTQFDLINLILLWQLNWQTPNTPYWCKNLDDMSFINWVMADFVSKWRQLVAMATRVGLTEIWIIPFDCSTPKTSSLVQTFARIFNGTRVMALRSCHIGRNANFQILGAKGGKFQFSLTKPYKEWVMVNFV